MEKQEKQILIKYLDALGKSWRRFLPGERTNVGNCFKEMGALDLGKKSIYLMDAYDDVEKGSGKRKLQTFCLGLYNGRVSGTRMPDTGS